MKRRKIWVKVGPEFQESLFFHGLREILMGLENVYTELLGFRALQLVLMDTWMAMENTTPR